MAGLYITVAVSRSPALSGGKIGAKTAVSGLAAVALQRTPASPQQIPDNSGMVLYRSFMLTSYTLPVPDIRVGDQLTDSGNTNPDTGGAVVYIVRGIKLFDSDHIEILAELPKGPGT